MSIDSVLTIVQALVAVLFGYAGIQITIYPPDTPVQKTRWKIIFGALLACGIGVTIWQAVNTEQGQREAAKESAALRNSLEEVKSAAARASREVVDSRIEQSRARDESVQRDIEAQRASTELLAEVRETKAKLDPFVALARERYPKLSPESGLERLSKELREVRALAAPNTLSLFRHQTTARGGDFVTTLLFRASKDEPLGSVQFVVNLLPGSDARIMDFWVPKKNFPAYLFGDDSKFIAPNGKGARLSYSLMGGGTPIIELTLSALASFRLEGTHGLAEVVVTPKLSE